jgi:hypothetical protein
MRWHAPFKNTGHTTANEPRNDTVGTYSLGKSKIKFLLPEGIQEQSCKVMKERGYSQVELMRRFPNWNLPSHALFCRPYIIMDQLAGPSG